MPRIPQVVGVALLSLILCLPAQRVQAQCPEQDMEGTWLNTARGGWPTSIKVRFTCPDVPFCPAFQPCFTPTRIDPYVQYFSGAGIVASGERVANRYVNSADNQTTRINADFRGAELLLLRWSRDEIIGFFSSASASYIGRYERKVVPTALSFNPSTVNAGSAASGTVTLSDPAPPSGAEVSLSSSKPDIALVPGSVTVPAGSPTQTFSVSTNAATCSRAVQITATRAGTSVSGPLNISSANQRPPAPTGFGLTPFKFGSVIVRWDSMIGVEKFILKRTRTGTGTTQTWEIGGTQTIFVAPAQVPCVGYSYGLQAFANLCASTAAGPIGYVADDKSCPQR